MPTHPPFLPAPRRIRLGAALVLLLLVPSLRAVDPTGEQIYRKKCASCHGVSGEGTKAHYPHPLEGNRTAAQLARYIAKSMPEDAPGTCTGAEADKVAAYLHEAFYSKVARERNQAVRIELARLTVRQYQNTIADLVGSFRSSDSRENKEGLRGEYFSARGFRNNQRVLDRLDREVKFDFQAGSPDAKIKPEEFAIRWQGSIFAPETGEYEFLVRTENGMRLWVNDTTRPLVDGWVRSGAGKTELRETIRLLGGRAYPLRLEFFKSKQAKEKTASIALEWKRPGGVAGPIPPHYLSPSRAPEVLVVSAAFPPDDRSLGWERATSISRAWDQATTEAALEVASYVTAHLGELAGFGFEGRDKPQKVRAFAQQFAERAFRRPLSEVEKKLFVDRPFETVADPEAALKRVVLFVLKSPRFLYREVGEDESYNIAARLAYTLWDAPPSDDLLKAAAAGRLRTREQVAAQAERMLADPRARVKLEEFFLRWLKVDQAPEIAKDRARFPEFTPEVLADLRTSLRLTIEDAVWSKNADFRRLLLTDELYLNGRLAKFYGVHLPADAPFQKVKLDRQQRAGVLTHPYLMATFAYTAASSPIHRGVFLSRGVLGLTLRPPQQAFAPLTESLHPNLTTRERVTLQTKPDMCQSCHGVINPLGFTLEHFDAVGRYRDLDNKKPVDSTGSYQTRTGEQIKFTGSRDLAQFLAASDEVQTAFVEQLFHYLVKQPIRAHGPRTAADLRDSFVKSGYNIQKLTVEVATVAALHRRTPQEPAKPETKTLKPSGK